MKKKLHAERPRYRGEDKTVVCVSVLRRQDGRKWRGIFWLRKESIGGILQYFWFHKRLLISQKSYRLLVFKRGFVSCGYLMLACFCGNIFGTVCGDK